MNIYADGYDITAAVGSLSWQNTLDELATTMTFSVAKDLGAHTSIYLPEIGSIVSYAVNGEEMLRGIVLSVDDGGLEKNTYTVSDYGFYLNKNQETYQFNGANASAAIKQMCSDFDIPIDNICTLPYSVTKIYYDKSVADIIKDILTLTASETGESYNLDVTPQGMRVYRIGDIIASPTFTQADNIQTPISSISFRGKESHKTSIENMRNSVKVITGSDEGYTQYALVQDSASIAKYGLLQQIEKIDDDETATARVTGEAKLKELNTVEETYSFDILEDIDGYTRAGAVIYDDEGSAYVIKSSKHNISVGTHKVTLELKRVTV